METSLVVARLIIAAVFAVAGVAKLADLAGARKSMADFGVPKGLAGMFGILLPVAELIVAAALRVPGWGLAAAAVAGLLAVNGWLLAGLLRQNGRLLLRIEALEAKLGVGDRRAIAAAYQCVGTPGAVIVNPDGTIGSWLAMGADSIVTLMDGVTD